MNKILKRSLKLIMAFIMTSILLTACGPKEDSSGGTSATGKPRVALMISGSLGDKSFFDSANEGMNRIKETYGVEIKVVEMGTDTTKFIASFEDVIDEGWDIIITGGINVSQPMVEVAKNYPEQKFILFDEAVDYSNGANQNIYSMTYKSSEGAYLAGVLAAATTTSTMDKANAENKIGFVGGFDIPLINDWLVGYIQGAQSVSQETKIDVGYIGSFTDAPKGKEVALSIYNSGSDVIFQAAGGAGLGAIDAAKDTNNYVIGTDSDQAELFKDDSAKADGILMSILKRVDESIYLAIGEAIEGNLAYGTEKSYGVNEGCVGFTDNSWYQKNVDPEIREKVKQAYDDIKSGKVIVKSAYDMSESEISELKKSVA